MKLILIYITLISSFAVTTQCAEDIKWTNGIAMIPFNGFLGYPEVECITIEDREYALVRRIYNLDAPIPRVKVEVSLREIGAETNSPKIIFLKEERLTEKQFLLKKSIKEMR